MGVRVIGTTSTPEKAAIAKQAGTLLTASIQFIIYR
jgi:hypothetical protein